MTVSVQDFIVFRDAQHSAILNEFPERFTKSGHVNFSRRAFGGCNRGLWYATSPDVKGLLVAEHTLEACLSEIVPTLERVALACRLETAR
jgi:hypothetical protein